MNVNYPSARALSLILEEARTIIRDAYDGNENEAPPILHAILDADRPEEIAFLGAALLARGHALSDPGYRFGEPGHPPRLTKIAAELGWAP